MVGFGYNLSRAARRWSEICGGLVPKFVIDLNTRILPPGHEAYVVRPGKKYRLYDYFIENQMILADLPLLDLKDGVAVSEHKDIFKRLERARALRSWYRRPENKKKPSTDLKSYKGDPKSLSLIQLHSVLTGMFEKVAVGDLVLVPPSAYSFPAYVGEIITGPTDYHSLVTPRYYGEDPLTGRKVKWLAQIEKRKLPDIVLDALEKPTSIFLLAKSAREPIYEAAYGSYVDLGEKQTDFSTRFFVKNDKFTTSADILLQSFFNFVASNAKSVDEQVALQGFYEAAFRDLGNYAPELKTNVNSPGFLTLISKHGTIPLVAAVMLLLAVDIGPEALNAAQSGQITIGNSKAPPNDECTAKVWNDTITQLKLLKMTEWPIACEKARQAADATGITSSVTIEKKP